MSKCLECKYYNKEKHNCPFYCQLIRETLNEAISFELEQIKEEIKEWYWQADKQKISQDPCVVDAMTDLFIRTVDNHISELKGDKCDNDHDCEHCDWVECPEMEGEKIKIPELTLIEGKDIPKDAVLLEAVIYLKYRKFYETNDYAKTLPVLVRIDKENKE